jgi:hypothetical protein
VRSSGQHPWPQGLGACPLSLLWPCVYAHEWHAPPAKKHAHTHTYQRTINNDSAQVQTEMC